MTTHTRTSLALIVLALLLALVSLAHWYGTPGHTLNGGFYWETRQGVGFTAGIELWGDPGPWSCPPSDC